MAGGADHEADRGPHDRCSPARPSSPRSSSRPSCSRARCCSRWRPALVVVTPISVAIAWIALPALLALLGERINMGAIGSRAPRRAPVPRRGHRRLRAAPPGHGRRADRGAAGAARRARPRLQHRRPGGQRAPEARVPARQSAEAIDRAVGPGWEAPFEIVVAARQGPITTQASARAAGSRAAPHRSPPGGAGGDRPGSDPAGRPAAARARRAPCVQWARRPRPSSPTSVPACAAPPPPWPGLRAGLSRAASGSGLLGEGSERAGAGAGLLAGGLERAAAGGSRASEALGRLATGTGRLAEGQREASNAGLALEVELHALVPSLRQQGAATSTPCRQRTGSGGRERPIAERDGQAGAAARPCARRPSATRSGACAKSRSNCTVPSNSSPPAAPGSKTGRAALRARVKS